MSEAAAQITDCWTTLRAYAAHKGVRLSAVQKAIKTGRIKADALRTDRRGRYVGIEQHRADRYWAENTDPVEAARNGKFHELPAEPAGRGTAGPETTGGATEPAAAGPDSAGKSASDFTPNSPQLPAGPAGAPAGDLVDAANAATNAAAGRPAAPARGGENDTYLQARTSKEQYAAKLAELEYLQAVGALVEAAAVGKALNTVLTQLGTTLMRIAERKAQLLATEQDPQRVYRILSEELRSALDECSRHFAELSVAGGTAERVVAVLPDSVESAGAGTESHDFAVVG